MGCHLVHIGFGNMAVAERVIAIIHPSSAPVRRMREEASTAGMLVDATQGRKTRAVLVMDSGHVIISAIQPETISTRFEGAGRDDDEGKDEDE